MYREQRKTMSAYYRVLNEKVRSVILNETKETIIGTDEVELSDFYYDKYSIQEINPDASISPSLDYDEYLKDIPSNQRGDFYAGEGDLKDLPCERVIYKFPIETNENIRLISELQADTYSLSSNRDIHWGEREIFCVIETKGYQFDYKPEEISRKIEDTKKRIENVISYKNTSITSYNRDLLINIKSEIQKRKKAIESNKQKIQELSKHIDIPLNKKESVHNAVKLQHKPLVKKIKPKPQLPEEYSIAKDKVNSVIEILDNFAKSYETTPAVIAKLGEEDIRDLILANLNSIFAGGATGETFNKKGKSDIRLVIDKGEIMICECKIWGGKKLYLETIDQLRGYLTWRQNYGVMITFVRNKNFTDVLTTSYGEISLSTSYINGLVKKSETHFVSNHTVDDEEKSVEIHHLFYHFPN